MPVRGHYLRNPMWKVVFALLANFLAWSFFLYFTPTSIIQTINSLSGLSFPQPFGNIFATIAYSIPPAIGGVIITYWVAKWTFETGGKV